MNDRDHDRMLASSKTYSKIGKMISDKYSVPFSTFQSGSRSEALMKLVDTVVKEECWLAVREAADRLYKHVFDSVAGDLERGLHVPKTKIRIDTAGVGLVPIRRFIRWGDRAARRICKARRA